MKAHTLYEQAMRRGDARYIDREMGYRTEGQMSRCWRRPVPTPDNLLFTGQPSPLVKAKAQLLAHDRVHPETADILMFDLFADLAMQRARRAGGSADCERDEVVSGLAEALSGAMRILLIPSRSTDEQEAALFQAGGKLVRALIFIMREGPEGEAPKLAKAA